MSSRISIALFLGFTAMLSFGQATWSKPHEPGIADPRMIADRKLDYLRFATSELDTTSVVNVLAHLERARQEPQHRLPKAAVTVQSWSAVFDRMAQLRDTRDFDALYLLHVLFRYRSEPFLAPGLAEQVEAALLSFKYWYTDPTPAGVQDQSWYWSENHQVVYYTVEYLMGQMYPTRRFDNDGALGSDHRERARARLLRWLEHRLRFGFSEWHSNVYYQKDIDALLVLVDYAAETDVRTLALAVLDELFLDLALHTHQGVFGATHGRSYKKDKMRGRDEGTWGMTKLLFAATRDPYASTRDPGATLVALSDSYDLPEVVFRIAGTRRVFVDRERMGLSVPESGPVLYDPVAPHGLSYSEPDALEVWWGMGAIAAWPVLPLSLAAIDRYALWELPHFAPVRQLSTLVADVYWAQLIASQYAPIVNFGLLQQVNTYTWRSPEAMLSSAVDYRKGAASSQSHSWQATLAPEAIVFTNHPFRPPVASLDWGADIESGGYWTGEASSPRSVQHENVAVHMYAPQYPERSLPPLAGFGWQPYTHAYFPQDHFDEVIRVGPWTMGRVGDGYVALYSFRPARFVPYDPTVYATEGMSKPFDLVAEGGADNVWIVECGRAADWGSFGAFAAGIAASSVQITPVAPARSDGVSSGFNVVYESPSRGRLQLGWDTPFLVNGVPQPTRDFDRFDNPWARTPFDAPVIHVEMDDYGLAIDLVARTRQVYGPDKKNGRGN